MKKSAMILSGCGFLDGAEINECIFSILALRQQGIELDFFAPDITQHHTIDHVTQKESESSRSVLTEASRIVRGNIRALSELNPENYQGLCLPGGFGVAKNLCSIAIDGASASVEKESKRVVTEFLSKKKPIMAVCIAPALIGLVAKELDLRLKLTHGASDNDIAKMNEGWGHQSVDAKANDAISDEANRIVSTPAFMLDISMEEAWPGIEKASKIYSEWL